MSDWFIIVFMIIIVGAIMMLAVKRQIMYNEYFLFMSAHRAKLKILKARTEQLENEINSKELRLKAREQEIIIRHLT